MNRLKKELFLVLQLLLTLHITGCSTFYEWTNDPNLEQKNNRGYRTIGRRLEDKSTEGALKRRLSEIEPQLGTHEINATSYNRVLLITGRVNSEKQKALVTTVARKLPYVDRLYNELEVEKLTDTIRNYYPTDQWITTRVKSRMFFTEQFPSAKLKVVTHNRTVYLLGALPKEEADKAVMIAKQVQGIIKIVKIIEPLDRLEQQTQSIQPVAPSPNRY